jgi:hypothetical protein
MEVGTVPAVNFAQRVFDRYRLEPPIDVAGLVRKYAELVRAAIPFENADGISINLKVPSKKTRVIVNTNNSAIRQRFTLAHELGHILIPWHIGTIIDNLEPHMGNSFPDYRKIEEEANRFAAALLMPLHWVEAKISVERNLAKVHGTISDECDTSALAAAMRLSQILPPNIVYASEKDGTVEFSGRTQGTLASSLIWGSKFPSAAYDYCEQHFRIRSVDRQLHWWKLPANVQLSINDERNWRDILDNILRNIGIPSTQLAKMKSSINGVVAYANGATKQSSHYGVDAVVSACIQRLKDRPEYSDFVEHPDFETFIVKKAEDLVRNHR